MVGTGVPNRGSARGRGRGSRGGRGGFVPTVGHQQLQPQQQQVEYTLAYPTDAASTSIVNNLSHRYTELSKTQLRMALGMAMNTYHHFILPGESSKRTDASEREWIHIGVRATPHNMQGLFNNHLQQHMPNASILDANSQEVLYAGAIPYAVTALPAPAGGHQIAEDQEISTATPDGTITDDTDLPIPIDPAGDGITVEQDDPAPTPAADEGLPMQGPSPATDAPPPPQQQANPISNTAASGGLIIGIPSDNLIAATSNDLAISNPVQKPRPKARPSAGLRAGNAASVSAEVAATASQFLAEEAVRRDHEQESAHLKVFQVMTMQVRIFNTNSDDEFQLYVPFRERDPILTLPNAFLNLSLGDIVKGLSKQGEYSPNCIRLDRHMGNIAKYALDTHGLGSDRYRDAFKLYQHYRRIYVRAMKTYCPFEKPIAAASLPMPADDAEISNSGIFSVSQPPPPIESSDLVFPRDLLHVKKTRPVDVDAAKNWLKANKTPGQMLSFSKQNLCYLLDLFGLAFDMEGIQSKDENERVQKEALVKILLDGGCLRTELKRKGSGATDPRSNKH